MEKNCDDEITVKATLSEYIRNPKKFETPAGYYFHCFISEGVEYSGIVRISEHDRVYVTHLWPYKESVIGYKRNILIVYRKMPEKIILDKLETADELVNRLAPKKHPNLVQRYADR